ncbi:hypothetical protein HDU91_001356, partial [Kappamyces sp. JEL0680]
TAITYQPEAETVTLEFEHEIPATANVILHMEFQGTHNDLMCGFYRSSYTDAKGNTKYLLSTQFENSDARRAFPCWDEPALKATFSITLHIPEGLVGLSNMGINFVGRVDLLDSFLTTLKFDETPKMSTYLLAFVVGDLEYVEATAMPKAPADAAPVLCRTYTLPGQKELGRFALDVSVKSIEFFSEYFNIAYPLPKLDQVAIPDFAAGAMENWGLLTYRESYLLYDHSFSAHDKEEVADTVAHEVAHQWFGNLVTMDWWDELWLKEGFATFLSGLAVDHFFPEWDHFTGFVQTYVAGAFDMDALRTSHPVQVPVLKPSDVEQIFDQISYNKGATLIRMLEAFLGQQAFAAGLSAYLQKHSYGNTTHADLWAALSDASGHDVGEMMDVWITETGYPYVSIVNERFDADKSELTLFLRQERFTTSNTIYPGQRSPVWVIPISVVTDVNPTSPTTHILKTREGQITFPYSGSATSFWKLNSEVAGFYRVNYTTEQIGRIGAALEANRPLFDVKDRVGLVSDSFAMAESGIGSTQGALELLQSFRAEENAIVLTVISRSLANLKNAMYLSEPIVHGVDRLTQSIFSPKIAAVGYDFAPDEGYLLTKKRCIIILSAFEAGDS